MAYLKLCLLLLSGALAALFVQALALAGTGNSTLSARQTESPVYLGCYAEGDGPRVLRSKKTSDNAATSYAFCTHQCFLLGFSLAGVEYGHECYCGNARLYDYGPGTCNTPCPGNSANTCGGSGSIQVYSTGAGTYTTPPTSFVHSYNGYKATECWKDEVADLFGGPHTLPNHPSNNPAAATMTVEQCIDACAADGYTSAGLRYGQECWCGSKEYPIGESTIASECQYACNGNAGEYCGGYRRLLAYTNLPWSLTDI